MNTITKNLKSNDKVQIIAIFIVFIMNIAIIITFMQFVISIGEAFEGMTDANDQQNFASIMSMITVVCIVSIIFFQWIIKIIYTSLFFRRRSFNISMRLIGAKQKLLSAVYLKETSTLFIMSLPFGFAFSELMCYILGNKYPGISMLPGFITIIIALLIHTISIWFTVLTTVKKLTNFNVVDELRGSSVYQDSTPKLKSDIIKSIIGVIFVGLSFLDYHKIIFANPQYTGGYSAENVPKESFYMLNAGLLVIGICFMLGVIFFCINSVLKRIGITAKNRIITLLSLNNIGYYKQMKPIITMMFVGTLLVFSLQSLFLTARNDAESYADKTIKYSRRYVLNEFISAENTNFTDCFKTATVYMDSGERVFPVIGIDENYASEYSDLNFNDGTLLNCNIFKNQSNLIYIPYLFIG